jgi:hypothetical protein
MEETAHLAPHHAPEAHAAYPEAPKPGSALAEIRSFLDKPDPFRDVPANLRELQLEAARERFGEMREKVQVLARHAKGVGVDRIDSLHDLAPLMFSHTTYKSYPESFVDRKQWKNMNIWLQTLAARPVTGVDVDGVDTADQWLERLHAAGHHTFTTSGTSGKCSFLDQSPTDDALAGRIWEIGYEAAWAPVARPNRDLPAFILSPPGGSHRYLKHNARFYRDVVSLPGECYFLSDELQKAHTNIRAGQLRRGLAAGTALPGEIAAFEAEQVATGQRMAERLDALADRIRHYRDRPICLMGQWGALFHLMEVLRSKGETDGFLHPESVITRGGGTKGVALPPDFQAQIQRFYGIGPERIFNVYGMSEVTGMAPLRHNLNAWAMPPWLITLVLDKSGTKLLNPEDGKGIVEGRMALFDLLIDGRWGGLITGDKVVVDFTGADGYPGPLLRSVSRYQDLEEGEDKLSCAGSADAYVRGVSL